MFSVLFIVKHRCSVLDIQLKREPDDAWSVSISHAAEVLENWNLIGFQVSNTLVIISFSCPALQTEKSGLQLHWVWHPLGRKVTVLSLGFPFRLPFTVVWVQIDIPPGRIQHYLREWCEHNIHTLTRFNFTQFIEHLCSVCQIRMCCLYSLCHCISPGFEI